jgi:hypothetical protein
MRGPQIGDPPSRGFPDDIGGTEDTCPVAMHLVSKWSSGVDARGRDTVVRCQNLSQTALMT